MSHGNPLPLPAQTAAASLAASVRMGMMRRLRDLDARGGSILPASNETRVQYLERLAASAGGVAGPAVSALAREVLEQRRTIAALEARLAEVEASKR